jgi:hypothetical protein
MWYITRHGFYSPVQKDKSDPNTLTVRARSRGDLERLIKGFLPDKKTVIKAGGGTDYPFRVVVSRADWETAAAALTADITYDNFKNSVDAVCGVERHRIYMRVWHVLTDIFRLDHPKEYLRQQHEFALRRAVSTRTIPTPPPITRRPPNKDF